MGIIQRMSVELKFIVLLKNKDHSIFQPAFPQILTCAAPDLALCDLFQIILL